MTAYYLDSSALVKRYVPETGTGWVRTITTPSAGHTILVAQMMQAEVISGVWRRVREGAIAPRLARAIRLLVDRHTRRTRHLGVSPLQLIPAVYQDRAGEREEYSSILCSSRRNCSITDSWTNPQYARNGARFRSRE